MLINIKGRIRGRSIIIDSDLIVLAVQEEDLFESSSLVTRLTLRVCYDKANVIEVLSKSTPEEIYEAVQIERNKASGKF